MKAFYLLVISYMPAGDQMPLQLQASGVDHFETAAECRAAADTLRPWLERNKPERLEPVVSCVPVEPRPE